MEGLQQNHAESAILQAMRRSTKSKEAMVAETLAKLDQMFGCVQLAEKRYEQFYIRSSVYITWRVIHLSAELKNVDTANYNFLFH